MIILTPKQRKEAILKNAQARTQYRIKQTLKEARLKHPWMFEEGK